MKRFWRVVGVVDRPGGFAVALDERSVKTPGKRDLVVPTRSLAEALAAEWDAQEETVAPHAMPLNRLANSALDGVVPQREDVVVDAARYGATDLVCYRAEGPPELVERQAEGWQPLIDWFAERYGIELVIASGVIPVAQPETALESFHRAVRAFDDFALTGVHSATTACGSLVIALALAHGHIDAETAWSLSQLDESFQIERWGEDAEAVERREKLRADIAAASRFMILAGDGR